MNGALRIAEALKPRLVSVTKLEGQPRMLFVHADRAVVYVAKGQARGPGRCTYAYDCVFAGDGTQTSILVFSIATDRMKVQNLLRLGTDVAVVALQ